MVLTHYTDTSLTICLVDVTFSFIMVFVLHLCNIIRHILCYRSNVQEYVYYYKFLAVYHSFKRGVGMVIFQK